MSDVTKRTAVLCILDGWGDGEPVETNAIHSAPTPTWDRMVRQYPRGQMSASGSDVGLPDGQMGNSEVGHLNLGAGRIVWQELPRINNAIADGSLAANVELQAFINKVQAAGGACHLIGLVSPGGVHSHQDHMVALARIVAEAGFPVRIHALTDGRDTPPRSAAEFVAKFERDLAGLANVRIATVIGRFYAMDRDNRWERVERAYAAMVDGKGEKRGSAAEAIAKSYASDKGDEFIEPAVIGDYAGMKDGDGFLFANFRADRVREIMSAIVDPAFEGFARPRRVTFSAVLGMSSYSETLDRLAKAIFTPNKLDKTLGQVVAEAGRTQLRLAETEKYPHVSYFFSGGIETPYGGEERILVPSPKVATYDQKPEMSALEVTDHLVKAITSRKFDLIVMNYANGDMVGHTGDLAAARAAVVCLDQCLARVEKAVLEAGAVMLVTADHGNCDQMVDPETGLPHTAHTTNPVPTVLVNFGKPARLRKGRLADVAPTLLQLMGLPQPAEMTGETLITEG